MIRKKRQVLLNNPRVVLGACAVLVGVGVLALAVHEVGAWLASRPMSPLVDYPGPQPGATGRQPGASRQPGTPQPRAQAAAIPYATPPAGGSAVAEPPVKPITLIPMLGEEHPDDAALITHYMRQIAGDTPPTLRDWQTLQASLPADKRGLLKTCLGNGHFVMSMCLDLQGNLWATTEGESVFRWSPGKPAGEQWRQYTKADGLLDDCFYAVACDASGRIWLGTNNHGVSVFNGERFQNYELVGGLTKADTLSGPLGEHVTHITVCNADAPSAIFHDPLTDKESPVSGSVWMCTSAGLSIYFPSTDTWSYLTRADGLPSDQANSLAFANDGTVFVASQCDGIAIASPKDGYKTWKQVTGPDELPSTPTGTGLPTNLMNDILVTKDGTVYTATTAGLAWSGDKGETWQYVRGADYTDKVKGLLAGPPKDWKPQPGAILTEDYTTALAEDANGNLIAGHRTKSADILVPNAQGVVSTSGASGYSHAVIANAALFCRATYGNGIIFDRPPLAPLPPRPATQAPMPAGAATPTTTDLEALAKRLTNLVDNAAAHQPALTLLPPDWATQGAWLGRVGRYWMAHAAAVSPYDLYWGTGAANVNYNVQQGKPGTAPNDSLRYWVSTNHTQDPRSLELTMPYLQSRVEKGLTTWDVDRRQSEWDDHAEVTSLNKQGPGLFFSIAVPPGTFILSFYNVNENGHAGINGIRDFLFSAREHPAKQALSDQTGFHNWPELVRARVINHYNGVYTRFLVHGPRTITIFEDRNASFNTNLNAAFLDEMEPFPSIYYGEIPSAPASASWEPSAKVVALLEGLWAKDAAAYATVSRTDYAAVARFLAQARDNVLTDTQALQRQTASTAWWLGAYARSEAVQHDLGMKTSREIEKALRWDGKVQDLYATYNRDLVCASVGLFQFKSRKEVP